MKATDVDAASMVRHVGRYVQAQGEVEVILDEQGALCMRPMFAGDANVFPPRRLRPAEQGLFLSEAGGNAQFLFVQFVPDGSSNDSAFLWNGKQVWRRVSVHDAP
ncbi:hypothetical protein XFF6994_4360001 [Xanthomonas citri pv. fuscans]|nr:hypothetical protein XFF6994_4360001 [Xanthomonas citri pv. fuscans]